MKIRIATGNRMATKLPFIAQATASPHFTMAWLSSVAPPVCMDDFARLQKLTKDWQFLADINSNLLLEQQTMDICPMCLPNSLM